MDIVVEFRSWKCLGVGCNWVQFAIWSCDWKDSSECIVGGISLDCNLSVQDPMGKDQSCGESLFKLFKGRAALIGEMPSGTLAGVKISQVVYLSNLNIHSNFTLFLLLSLHSLSNHSSYTVISGVLFHLLFSCCFTLSFSVSSRTLKWVFHTWLIFHQTHYYLT